MTEKDWLTTLVPEQMLNYLERSWGLECRTCGWVRPESSLQSYRGYCNECEGPLYRVLPERKLRLFACACSRMCPELLPTESAYRTVEAAEAFADGHINSKQLHRARLQANGPVASAVADPDAKNAATLTMMLVSAHGRITLVAETATHLAEAWRLTSGESRPERVSNYKESELQGSKKSHKKGREVCLAQQAHLLRDVFGNPWRPIPFLDEWRTPEVRMVAQSVYDQCLFSDLPILADALEEAGCRTEAILNHARGPLTHIRGCWLVDLILFHKK